MSNANSIRCLITAGPTREHLDPVRFLSNPSTGKMGYALADAAVARGWTVDLVAGPVALEEPENVVFYPVISAEEMFHQVDALFDVCDVLIMTAAVSDFRPVKQHKQKEKKQQASLTIEFERTIDILKTMTERKQRQMVVGFAAETDNVEEYARKKLFEKRCDWMVANKVGEMGAGFASDTNTVMLIGVNDEPIKLGPAPKSEIARELIDRIALALS